MRALHSSAVRRLPALLLFLLVALATTAAGPTPQVPGTGRVEGHVRDQNGAPLANAQVFVVGTAFNALSDSLGAYSLPAVPEGRQELRAAFIGYRASQATITVRAGKTTTHDFTLEATAVQVQELTVTGASRDALQGRVEADPGAPSAGAVSKQSYAYPESRMAQPWRRQREPGNTEAYARIEDNRFLAAFTNPLSTFSVDVDAASYSNVRRFLSEGAFPRPMPSAWRSWSTTSAIAIRTAPGSIPSPWRPTWGRAPGRRSTGWFGSGFRPGRSPLASCRPVTWYS